MDFAQPHCTSMFYCYGSFDYVLQNVQSFDVQWFNQGFAPEYGERI